MQVILCGVGTAVEAARQKSWCRLEGELFRMGYSCTAAFTSPLIRKKLAENGVFVPSPEEALDAAGSDVFLLPLMLCDGEEYRKLAAIARERGLPCGRPILEVPQARRTILRELCQKYPYEKNRQILLTLHGSSEPMPVHLLAEALPEGRGDVQFVQLNWENEPVLPAGTEKVLLVPLMLTAGHHVRKDLEGGLLPRLRAAGYEAEVVREGLAEGENFAALVAGLIPFSP